MNASRVRPWSTWSLRTRLLVTTTLMLAVVCGVIGFTTTALLQANLNAAAQTRLDQALDQTTNFLRGPGSDHGQRPVAQPGGRGGLPFVMGLPDKAIGGTVLNGTVTAGERAGTDYNSTSPTPNTVTLSAAQAAPLLVAEGGVSYLTVDVPGFGTYLVSSKPVNGTTVLVGIQLDDARSMLTNLIAAEAVVTVAGLIAAGFVSFALIRLSLKPLNRVAATAVRISRLPLDRGEVAELVRVPDSDTDVRTEAGQVGSSLNRLIDHVSDALAARHASETRVRQFVADASHELRTPLASIAGYAELTRRGREAVPPDTSYALSRIESEAARMTRLVEDLLLLARLDAGRPLEREPLDLAPLVMDAVRDAHAASPDRAWKVDLPDEPVQLDGDPHRLHQVLVNLLSNAGKHTPPGTTVTASVSVPDPDHCELRISDNGPGIPEALLPTVFERFARGDSSRSRAAGSTGLGLAIVAAVTASHGGTVSLTSGPGRTVFTVRLPLAAAGAAAGAPALN